MVLNRGVLRPVDPKHFTAAQLQREAVMRLLSLDLQNGVVTLRGKELEELAELSAEKEGRKSSLVFLGFDPGAAEVNGRPLHPEDDYRVAATTYLLAGGDNYPPLAARSAGARILPAPDAAPGPAASLALSDQAEVRRHIVLPRLSRLPNDAFIDLNRRALCRFGVDELAFYVEGVETDRDEAYDSVSDSRATADASSTVCAALRLRLDQDRVGWSWQNRLEARFGLLDADGTGRRDVDDDLRFETSAAFTKLRFLRGEPYLSFGVDTELRRNPASGGGLNPRKLEQSLAAGLDWAHGYWERLRLGAVARHYSNSDQADRSGFEAEAHYLWPPEGRRAGFEGRLLVDSLHGDANTIDRADLGLRLLMPIWGALELTPAVTYYVYRDSDLPGDATYYRLSLGLTSAWAGKYQNLD